MDPSSRGLARADSINEYSSQFKATQTWNRIAREFRDKMPTKKRWRQLRSFENSFTGKEATDFMITILPGLLPNRKEITRESCVALLQKFADNNLFKYAWTAEKTTFQDNATLFVWNGDSTLNGVCRTPILMRRASSFNNGSADRPRRRDPTTPKPLNITSPDNWKTFQLPKSPPKHKSSRNRRLSSSTGNLSLIGVEKFDCHLSPRMGERDPIIEEGSMTPEKNEDRKEVEHGEIRRGTKEDITYGKIGRKLDNVYGEIGKKENMYGEIGRKKKEPIYVASKDEIMRDTEKLPIPTLLKSSPVYASFAKREDRRDIDKENSYEYVTFRRKNGMHTPSKGLKRGVQSSKEKKNDSNQVKSVISRLTPSRFKGKENEIKEVSPPAPPPSAQTVRREDPVYSSIRIRPRPILTDNDEWNVYSAALTNRVRSLLGYMEERERERESLITWRVDGQHASQMVVFVPSDGESGTADEAEWLLKVIIFDDWSPAVLQQMEYLKHFPFHTKNVTVITYTDKQEVKVFRTVVAYLKKSSPLVEAAVGHAFLTVINHFKKLSRPLTRPSSVNSGSSSKSGRLETAFSIGSPTTRLLPQISSSSMSVKPMNEDLYATPIPFHARPTLTEDAVPFVDVSPIPTTLTHRHTSHTTPPQGPLRVDPKSGMKARDILMEPLGDRILRLPGLKHSPDLIERIKNLSPRVSAIPFPLVSVNGQGRDYHIPPMLDPPVLEGISLDMDPALFETLQLLLLSLPVVTRRKLQLLLKFINDISNNHCLSLEDDRENRYVALDALCDVILAAKDDYSMNPPLSHSERINLVSMLIDNEPRLFRIPDDFEARVENVLIERRRTKLEFDDSNLSMAPPAPIYCQRIQPEVYSAQMKDTNSSLISLLDDIISNSRMSISEREKKLKAFEKSHPSIFYERFPERLQKKQEGGFLHKIFRSRND